MPAIRWFAKLTVLSCLSALADVPSYDRPQVTRSTDTAEVCLDFSELLAQARSRLKSDFPPLQTRAVIDGEKTLPIPPGQSRFCFRPSFPQDQHDVTIEVLATDGQSILHRTFPRFVPEAKTPPAIDPASFAAFLRPEALLPERAARAWGIDVDLTRLTSEIGYSKIVLVPKAPLRGDTPHVGGGQRIQVQFEQAYPKLITLTDLVTGQITRADPSPFEIKVDAAFNGNAFFWDDMFVSWATSWHDPMRTRSTLDFWYGVQALDSASPGSIPREVRKNNLRSFNPYLRYDFSPEPEPNLDYSNPNLSGMTEWQLFALSDPHSARQNLPRAIHSMQNYAAWFERERATRDAQGQPVAAAFITSNLGSGMDNSPRGGADATRASWVDMLAQHIELHKNIARMQMATDDWSGAQATLNKVQQLEAILNRRHWDEQNKFYFDLLPDAQGALIPDTSALTIAGFWPLWSGSVAPARVDALIERQLVPGRFGGEFPLPSLSAEHPLYSDEGHYWRGGRWPNMAAIAIQGFETSERPDMAFELTRKFLRGMSQASKDAKAILSRGTVYEFYGVKHTDQGLRAMAGVEPGHTTRWDFVGWGKVPPVQNMIRHLIGLRPVPGYAGKDPERWLRALTESPVLNTGNYFGLNPARTQPEQRSLAAQGYLEWNLMFDPSSQGMGVKNIEYQGQSVRKLRIERLGMDTFMVTVQSDQPFTLQVNRLFRVVRESEPESSVALRAPLAMSPLLRVGGAGHEKTLFKLDEIATTSKGRPTH